MTAAERLRRTSQPGLLVVLVTLALALLASACAKEKPAEEARMPEVIPETPSVADFGPLFPRIQSDLNPANPDVFSALRDTRDWAATNLEGFALGACATAQVVFDGEFTRIFGKSTLGVTLPWMQIYVRDGNRAEGNYLWRDPSLFVSTVLHEYVHAIQRAKQAHEILGVAPNCAAALGELATRRPSWMTGFDLFRSSPVLTTVLQAAEKRLLYRWISPIERAHDEIEAAITTVNWMHNHSNELGEFTVGGANNWAYGVQYLKQLGGLARSNCFSPDEDTFAEERRIFENEIPRLATEFARYETAMKVFLSQHNIPVVKLTLGELEAAPNPTGREGSRCNSSILAESPSYPFQL